MRIMFRHTLRYVAGALLLFALSTPVANAQDYATGAKPLAFGPSQTIIDLNKVDIAMCLYLVWRGGGAWSRDLTATRVGSR